MSYMAPRPEGLNTDPAPPSVVETMSSTTALIEAYQTSFQADWNDPAMRTERDLFTKGWYAAQSAGQEPVAYLHESTGRLLHWQSRELCDNRRREWTALGRIAAPVNGGERAIPVVTHFKDLSEDQLSKRFLADAQQVDADATRDPFGCLNCTHADCGRYIDGSRYLCHAMRDNACARHYALTSPAKEQK